MTAPWTPTCPSWCEVSPEQHLADLEGITHPDDVAVMHRRTLLDEPTEYIGATLWETASGKTADDDLAVQIVDDLVPVAKARQYAQTILRACDIAEGSAERA